DHAMIVSRSLKKEGFIHEIERVRDGVEAMRYLRKQGPYATAVSPDVVLLDLNLPKKDGHEVLAEIKEDPLLRKIPTIILTTSDAESDKLKAYEHYANSYLVKPLDPNALRDMIADLSYYWGIWNKAPVPPQTGLTHIKGG
ncbi:MAG: response regulator, partial [Bdellovibrio sp.]